MPVRRNQSIFLQRINQTVNELMRVALQPSYVLHSRPFRDSSVLLDLFTAEHGRTAVIGRGLSRKRRGGSLGALLQPFQPLLLSFGGRGDLLTLTAAETAGAPIRLVHDALISGFYLNELLLRLTHRLDPQPTLFSLYGDTLASLAGEEAVLEGSLRRFEYEALDQLGYGVDLRHDARTGSAIDEGAVYLFTPEYGFSAMRAESLSRDHSDPGSGAAESGLYFKGGELLAIADGHYLRHPATSKRLARLLLQPHLGDKPLRSRQMFVDMKKAGSPSDRPSPLAAVGSGLQQD
ncbi:MAG: DNA repair protein RecO [Pseudomonadota bacterium]